MYNKRAFYKNCHNHSHRFGNHGEHPFKKAWKEKYRNAFHQPPANVRELDDSYELHVFAPGLSKHDFDISTSGQILSISVESKKEAEGNWKRQEFIQKGFTRQFELNEKIDTTAITGQYNNGVLILTLPKLDGFETSRQAIEID